MIDFHCHLDLYPQALSLLPEVQSRNRFTFVVTTSPRAYVSTSRMFAGYNKIHVGVGLHPEVAEAKAGEMEQLVELVAKVPLIGEIGLDGSPRFKHSLPVQERIFSAVLSECALRGGRIMSIHSRGAQQRVLDALARFPAAGVPVLHWFSGGQRELRRAVELGAWFSVGPAMLKSERGRQLAAAMPRERVLPETDGPFTVLDGAPLLPWQAWGICATLVDLWNLPVDTIEEQMRMNLRSLAIV